MRNDVAAARAMVEDGIRAWDSPAGSFQLQHYFASHSRCEIAIYARDTGSVDAELARTVEAMRTSRITRIPVMRLELELLRGRLALATGDASGAMAAAKRARRVSLGMSEALAELLRGLALRCDGREDAAVAALERAEPGLERYELRLHLAAARFRRGELVGGSEGDALCGEADRWLRAQGVVDPAALLALVAPAAG
jgi:hypothetical protein